MKNEILETKKTVQLPPQIYVTPLMQIFISSPFLKLIPKFLAKPFKTDTQATFEICKQLLIKILQRDQLDQFQIALLILFLQMNMLFDE